jgi:carbon monoxide dehydrogenase subunit G
MSTVKETIDIAAPVEKVWETVMDPHHFKDWVTIHRRVKKIDEPLKEGSTMEQVLHVRGVSFTVNWTLVDCDEPKSAVWEGKGPARSKAVIRYELSADGDGATKFSYTNEFTPPGGRLGTIAGRVVVGAASEREAKNSLRQLKELLEGS